MEAKPEGRRELKVFGYVYSGIWFCLTHFFYRLWPDRYAALKAELTLIASEVYFLVACTSILYRSQNPQYVHSREYLLAVVLVIGIVVIINHLVLRKSGLRDRFANDYELKSESQKRIWLALSVFAPIVLILFAFLFLSLASEMFEGPLTLDAI